MERLQVRGFFSLIILTAAQTQSTTHSPDPGPSYLLLTPSTLRAGVPTSVTVTILTASPVTVSVLILHGNHTVASDSATVEGGSTELLTLPPIHQGESGDRYPYTLEVKGHEGSVEVFSNSTQLRFDPKSISTFTQTDKSKYRPGQMVKIRVVSIQPNGRPYVSPVDIIIRDPRGQLLRQWLSLDGVLGVVSREFQLSENPPLGEWTIVTTVGSVSSEKHFIVAYYVLPKFEVEIETKDVVYHRDTVLVRVTARYMHGTPVQGNVNVTYLHNFHGIEEAYHEHEEIDGMQDFVFYVPNPDYRPMSRRFLEMVIGDGYTDDEYLMIVVHVTDNLTGLTYSSTAKVSLLKSRYIISFDGSPQIFRPSSTYQAMLKITTYDNQPLTWVDQEKIVRVTVMQLKQRRWRMKEEEMAFLQPDMLDPPVEHPEEMLPEEMEFHRIPPDGCLSFDIHITNETETLTVDADFEDSHDTLHLSRTYTSPSHTFLQIERPSQPPQAGLRSYISIKGNYPPTPIHHIVKSRGQVVSAGTTFDRRVALVPEATWAPVACVIVFCVLPSGEIINDVLRLPVALTLQNQVSLSFSDSVRKPGEDVTLRVTVSEPASLVGILVVDKATTWKGSKNDITKETVLKEMSEFATDDAQSDMMLMEDPYSIFKTCDLLPLTDATLHQRKQWPKPSLPGEEIFLLAQTDGSDVEKPGRSNFPETWIWMDINTGNSDSAEMTVKVPDSITTWTATAFVMSENLGLGVTDTPVQLTVFQDVFLSLNLPAFIIRGEELLLEVILFNFLSVDLEVTVTVLGTSHFVFLNNEELSANVRKVFVGRRGGASVLIPIRPLVLGEMPVSVRALSAEVDDVVTRMVLVKAEGLEQSHSASLLLEVSPSRPSILRYINFTFPPDVVGGSERATVTAIGDILGPSISGLDSLIKMPYGCGEQNMINFAPNIYVLQYLSAVGRADQEITDRATNHMTMGYERELTYQRGDGSFSAFGDQDSSGSTWLTAFVLRCFLQARPFISIDALVLQTAAAWLVSQQDADGRSVEDGRVIHTELQGGLDGVVSLTAYVVIALLEDGDIKAQYSSQVSAALMYLETRLALGVSSNYSLSLLTYALALSHSSNAEQALSHMLGRAEMRDGVPMWSSPGGGLSSSWQPRSADIEMASYVLLSLHRLGHITEGLGLVKWLSQQRNHLGGYGSTQDTIVALQALSVFAAFMSHDVDLDISVKILTFLEIASFHIDQDNYLLHQVHQIPPYELNLAVSAGGRGFALFQLNVFYNIRNEEVMRRRKRHAGEHEAFHLEVDLYDRLDSAELSICFSLTEAAGLNVTGMAIIEVGLLTVFSLHPDGVSSNGIVKKVETTAGKVILYLDSVTKEMVCVMVPLVQEYEVGNLQNASVIIYDYYEPRRRTVTMYAAPHRSNMSSCFFCGGDCSQCRPEGHYGSSIVSNSSQKLLMTSLTPAPLLLLLLFLLLLFIIGV